MNRREFSVAALAAMSVGRGAYAADVQSGVRFSVMMWTLDKKLPFEQKVEMVAAAGFQGIELVGEYREWNAEKRQQVVALLRSKGLTVDSMSGVKTGFAVPDKQEQFKSDVTDLLKTANEMGCPQIILLSGNVVSDAGREQQWKTSVENLKWAAGEAAKAKVEIVIEPIDLLENPKIYLSTVSDAFRMAQEVGSAQVKVLYDLYHEQRSYGNLMEKLEKNIAQVGLIHVADVPGRHEPGTGEVRYDAIFKKLGELGYSRWIAMEFLPTGDAVSTLRTAREKALTAMRRG